MKKLYYFLFVSLIMNSFLGFSQTDNDNQKTLAFGENFDTNNVLEAYQMQERYDALKAGDTLNVVFKGEVASVCKNKGCWMKVALEDGREVMVKFKDYAFFMPKDIENKEVTMEGKAYITEMSVKDRKHYAEDAGKSAAEVAAITEPEVTLSFLADGVSIKL